MVNFVFFIILFFLLFSSVLLLIIKNSGADFLFMLCRDCTCMGKLILIPFAKLHSQLLLSAVLISTMKHQVLIFVSLCYIINCLTPVCKSLLFFRYSYRMNTFALIKAYFPLVITSL